MVFQEQDLELLDQYESDTVDLQNSQEYHSILTES